MHRRDRDDLTETTEPTQPSTAFLDAMRRTISEGVAAAQQAAADDAASPEAYPGQTGRWEAIEAAAKGLREELGGIVSDLYAHPETAFEEHRSAAVLGELVARHGHRVTAGAYGVETAFESRWATPGFDAAKHPTVAILAEYDALPGIGHACGHNIIAAAGVGAYLALTQHLGDQNEADAGVKGRVVLLGTPAEEGHTGKEYMIRGGCLDGIDAAVMVHGFGYDIACHSWVGRRSVTADFIGRAAHASAQPFMGRNALDAAALAYQGIGLLRQQMPPSDRLHAIITRGGERPSVIPQHARLEMYVRSTEVDTLLDLSHRLEDVVRGAALMAGCGVELNWDPHPMSLPVRNNTAMAARWTKTQARRGRTALPAGVIPEALAASTDFGNVSHLVPGIHPMVQVSPPEVALHTEEFARWANSPAAYDAAMDSAVGLAQVACDLLADAALLDAAKSEFAAAGGPRPVEELE